MSNVNNRVERCVASRLIVTYGFSVMAFAALVGIAEHWYTCVACVALFLFAWLMNPLPDKWHTELIVSGVVCCYVVFDVGLQNWCGWLSAILLLCLCGWLAMKIYAIKKRSKIK